MHYVEKHYIFYSSQSRTLYSQRYSQHKNKLSSTDQINPLSIALNDIFSTSKRILKANLAIVRKKMPADPFSN